MTKEDISITYENNVFYCTKNGTKWISVDGEKWYGEEKRIIELEKENRLLGERCNQLLKDKGDLTDKIADIKTNCDLAIEGRDIKIRELEQKLKQSEEIIKKLYKDCYSIADVEDLNIGLWEEDLNQAQQFIKEIEKC